MSENSSFPGLDKLNPDVSNALFAELAGVEYEITRPRWGGRACRNCTFLGGMCHTEGNWDLYYCTDLRNVFVVDQKESMAGDAHRRDPVIIEAARRAVKKGAVNPDYIYYGDQTSFRDKFASVGVEL